jgi:hypothetical protein
MGTIQLLLPGTILTRLHHTNPTSTLLPRTNLSDSLGGSSTANSLEAFELRRETYTHTHFSQSVVSSADPNADRSTSPHNRSLVSHRPLHRHAPSAVFKAFPRQNQVDDLRLSAMMGDGLKPATPQSR